MKVLEVLRERHYEHYDIRDEVWDSEVPEQDPLVMKRLAYSKAGDWIGNSVWAHRLVHRYGVTRFEKTDPKHCICSIGFALGKERWFGWSHRAIASFGVGSTCRKGDCHYLPVSFDEVKATCECLEGENCHAFASVAVEPVDPNEPEGSLRPVGETMGIVTCSLANCPIGLGHGEWVAGSLEEAKEMAVDFAKSVS